MKSTSLCRLSLQPVGRPLTPRRARALQQAQAFASSLIKGDPDEVGVIAGTVRQVLSSVLPGRD
jgi:hypothetical protein